MMFGQSLQAGPCGGGGTQLEQPSEVGQGGLAHGTPGSAKAAAKAAAAERRRADIKKMLPVEKKGKRYRKIKSSHSN